MKLSLVVPCYNEQDNVRAFYDAAVNAFLGCGYEYELVMVNDGSRDNTGIELKKLFYEKREETPITIVQFSRNFGKEAAILAGMKHAKGDLVTLIDADLQQLLKLCARWFRYWMNIQSMTVLLLFKKSEMKEEVCLSLNVNFIALSIE